MVNEELVEGIRRALTKGESLQQAMSSFYNAGYERGEIESAARFVQMEQFQNQYNSNNYTNINSQNQKVIQPISPNNQQPKNQNKEVTNQQIAQKISAYGNQIQRPQQPMQMPNQNINQVSNYENFPEKKLGVGKTILIVLLVIFLLALAGGLIASLVFKEEIINFFNNL
jgi:hypothetical protein